jgi:lysyl-tRNA synthetase class 2
MAMLEKIRQDRIKKLEEFRNRGINPYPSKSHRTAMAAKVVDKYDQMEGKEVTVSGRAMSWRDIGKIVFADLKDGSGEVQLYMKQENMEDQWDELKLYDVGDFVDATGTVTKTKTGEISVEVTNLRILAKAIRPLPEKWEGIKDEDVRFRQRYLDFLTNPEAKEKIEKRGELLQLMREFFYEKGFLEIENPSLELNPSGAEARPFITHINAYDMDVYLRICAGELWQKMSTIGGFEKVFEIARAYRNEGVDAGHNPEFTMLEFYWAYATIEDNIELHQELFALMAEEIAGGYKFEYHGKTLDLTPPYEVAKYNDLFKEHIDIDLNEFDELEKFKEVVVNKGVELEEGLGWSTTIDQVWKQKVRPNLFKPVFVTDYPYILTPLAKKVSGTDQYVQMSQLLLDSMEMCRMYGELNDPIDQMQRFQEQQKAKEAGDEEAWGADYEFVEAMEYGMPPQSGSGIGIDRWVKVLTDAESLREVIAYPIMKPEKEGEREINTDVAGQDKLEQDFSEIFAEFEINPEEIEIPSIQGDDYLSLSEKFSENYPTASAGYIVIEGAEVGESNEKLMKLTNKVVKSLKGLTKGEIDNSTNIQSYRDMYRDMGVDWHSRRPSPEALLRRISQGKDLYQVNDVVDAYNLAVLTQQVSVGVFDMDHMEFPVRLDISDGSDEIDILGGEVKEVEEDEVCYFDQNGPYNLDYNYRDSERTKITTESQNLIINAEGVGEITPDQVRKTLQLAAALILKFCGGEIKKAGLVRASGEVDQSAGKTSKADQNREVGKNQKADASLEASQTPNASQDQEGDEKGSVNDSPDLKEKFPHDDKKISVVVAKDLEPGIAMNTVGHLTTSIGVKADDIMGRQTYTDASGNVHQGVPRYPVIILKASKKEIKKLVKKSRQESKKAGDELVMVDYPSEVFSTRTDDDLSQAVSEKEDKDIEYFGVALCGDVDIVEELTKNFSLYR